MNAPANRFPLFLKISALLVLLSLVIVVPSGILVVNKGKELVRTEMIQRCDLLVRHLAASAEIPLLSGDSLALKVLVRGMDRETGILYAFINDRNHKVLAHTGSIEAEEVLRLLAGQGKSVASRRVPPEFKGPKGNGFFDISAPVVYHDKTVGSFHLGLSQDVIDREMKDVTSPLIRTYFLYGIPGLILCLVVLFFWSSHTAGQVLSLVSGMNELNSNNFGTQIKEVPHGLFGDLVSVFNRLSLSLQQRCEREKTIVLNSRPGAPFLRPADPPASLLPTQITRNQIAVLFAGVKGFREYADNRAPEDVIVDLNEYFALAARIAGEHDGQVDKFIGDAVSCVFQSSPLKPDHMRRAVEAAVALQAALADQSQNGNDIMSKIAIGISSGVALSGSVEAPPDKVHTYIGESFKTAYSLNVLAGPGEIIMSKDVFQAVEDLVTVEPVPPREMMDKTEAWENFRLKGLLPKEDDETPSP